MGLDMSFSLFWLFCFLFWKGMEIKMTIELVRPAEEFKGRALEFRQEFFDHGELIMNGSELLIRSIIMMNGLEP